MGRLCTGLGRNESFSSKATRTACVKVTRCVSGLRFPPTPHPLLVVAGSFYSAGLTLLYQKPPIVFEKKRKKSQGSCAHNIFVSPHVSLKSQQRLSGWPSCFRCRPADMYFLWPLDGRIRARKEEASLRQRKHKVTVMLKTNKNLLIFNSHYSSLELTLLHVEVLIYFYVLIFLLNIAVLLIDFTNIFICYGPLEIKRPNKRKRAGSGNYETS